ncbi:MAG: winged helix DNA-binding domain-containing protein [Clostridia bacterium]|nr:winged helix DNA-binding domain-containing protein [Clostridia bacterium]
MELHDILLCRLHAQHLLAPVNSLTAARDLCGFQAQFLRNAVHALRLRTDELNTDGLIKSWTLRGTVHLFPRSDLPLYFRRCGTADDVCESGWYQWVSGRGHATSTPERERYFANLAVEAIAQGNDTREGLRALLRDKGMTEGEESHVFNGWGGLISELAGMGVIGFRVEMKDGVYADETKRYCLLPKFEPMAEEAARLELARRYFTHFGPATLRDAAYFLHWTQKEVREQLAKLPVQTIFCDGCTYYAIENGEPVRDMPPVILLAGFDQLMLGYRKEDNPFLPTEHLRGIFNLAGIVHPAILLYGRGVGRWKEKDGKVELTAFETIKVKDKKLIEREVKRLFTVKKLIWV